MFDFLPIGAHLWLSGGDGRTNIKLMVSGLRTCVLCLQPPSGQSKLSTTPAEPPMAVAPRLSHQGCAWRANKEVKASSCRGEGGSWWFTDAPLTGTCLALPEVAFPRSVHRKTGSENKITRANMQMKQNQRKTLRHYRHSDRGNPGLLLPVAGGG